MSVRRLGFVSFITVTLVLGWFFSAWSAAQNEERESYRKDLQEKLQILDKKIDELKEKAAEVKGEAKAAFAKEMAELHKKQKIAKKEWERVKRATANTWEKAKAGMDTAIQEVENAYDKAVSRFKERKG